MSATSGNPALMTPPPLHGWRLVLAALALALSNFVVVLDITIANVSVPHIAGSLAITQSQGTWVVTSYSVAEAISVPLAGWLAGRFGAVRVLIFGMSGFALFSVLCGLAPTLEVLIAFRVMQGFCGGPIVPMSQTLMLRVFPQNKAPMALGVWSMTTVVAPIAGPILGGVISDNWTWPWIFYINLPVVALCVTLIWQIVRGHETPTARNPIDYVGLVLLIVWVGTLQIMLDKGREEDWFASSFIIGTALVAGIGFITFLIWELTDAHPIVNLSVFRHRGFSFGAAIQSLIYGAFFAGIVLIPLFLQSNLGYTATSAGQAAAFLGVLAVVFSPIAAQLVSRVDVRLLVTFGVVWMSLTTYLRSGWVTDMNFYTVALPQFVQGLAMPFFFIGTTSIALGAVKPEETASAAGSLNFLRTLAGAVATSVGTTIWENRIATSHDDLAGALQNTGPMLQQLMHTGMSHAQAIAALDRIVQVESVTMATDYLFRLLAAVFLVAGALVWFTPKPARAVDLSAAH